jgi:enoyl-[acyl-carrier protein] reductase I
MDVQAERQEEGFMQIINLKGKKALVTGVADNVGFGWHIAKSLQAAGAEVIISCHPRVQTILERFLTKEKYAQSRQLPYDAAGELKAIAVIPCDVTYDTAEDIPLTLREQKGYAGVDASIEGLMKSAEEAAGGVDILIHSVAFSPEVDRSHLEVSRQAYLTAMSASSYSLIALTRAAAPLMKNGQGHVVGLSYLAAQRAVPFYGGGMAAAKAALECDARMLAWHLGEAGHTVNIVSPGPYASRAAKSIGDIAEMIDQTATRSPLRRSIEAQDVANSVLFLCSPLASNITGEVIFVDAGFHAMGM